MKYQDALLIKKADGGIGSYDAALDYIKNTRSGQDALGRVSGGELLVDTAGAVGGGALGYLLAKALHRRPSAGRKLLYTLLGAGVGGLGAQYAMGRTRMDGDFKGTLRQYLRLKPLLADQTGDPNSNVDTGIKSSEFLTAPGKAYGKVLNRLGNVAWSNKLTAAGAATGALSGLTKKFELIDLSGRRKAQQVVNRAVSARSAADVLKNRSLLTAPSARAVALATERGVMEAQKGYWLKPKYWMNRVNGVLENRAGRLLGEGNLTPTGPGNMRLSIGRGSGTGSLARHAGRVAADVGANAGAYALLGWLTGKSWDSLASKGERYVPDFSPEALDRKFNR